MSVGYFSEVEPGLNSDLRNRKVSLLRMALNTLKHRDIAEVYRVLERFVGLVTELAFVFLQRAQNDGMNKRTRLNILFRRSS